MFKLSGHLWVVHDKQLRFAETEALEFELEIWKNNSYRKKRLGYRVKFRKNNPLYTRVRWSEMQSPRQFCWRVYPGWLIGYRICDITFFVPNQLHLILQLLCSLTSTCYTHWSLKLSLLVQLGYHMGYNESENVNFSGRSYEAKVTTYLSYEMR